MAPHATGATQEPRRRSSSIQANGRYKFPDISQDHLNSDAFDEEELDDISTPNGLPPGLHSNVRWPARKASRKDGWSTWTGKPGGGGEGAGAARGHGRQKSLSEAIQVVRTRKASISENAHEIAEALKAPVSLKLVLLCAFWYTTSILTNTSSKSILTTLNRPVTLTLIQFGLVTTWCLSLAWLAKHNRTVRDRLPVLRNGIRKPSKDLILTTLPLTAFQIGGHILNSDAMARIPVSLVHTIKGLSPLMTVLAYRLIYHIPYPTPTYLSLIPLTLGVILACSTTFAGNLVGLTYAFGSAILFVTQNIVSKQLFNSAAQAEADGLPVGRRKPDKLNLLCYSSALAFLITCPIWLWSEGLSISRDFVADGSLTLRDKPGSLDHGRLAAEFLFNGTFHFAQSLVAFVLLGMVSPVTYSVASLIKRVVVIMFAIVWFGNPMTRVQGFGFALTFVGLYLYDRTSDSAKADKRAREKGAESNEPLLPTSIATDVQRKRDDGQPSYFSASPMSADFGSSGSGYAVSGSGYALGGNGHANGAYAASGDVGHSGPGRARGNSRVTPPAPSNGVAISLPPGTKAEETWRQGDGGGRQQQGIGVR
ncbi:hypothetical protein LTR08_003134 [Meristemomyces frigidus]|nr:hypothetical protein LTR08_003134 [Meristemomyces frigidus]